MASRTTQVVGEDVTTIAGTWQRHVAEKFADEALDGRPGDGRWSVGAGFPVLYLGTPTESVVVEAYRHLVDAVEGMLPTMVAARALVTCSVHVDQVLDLRSTGTQRRFRLTEAVLCSPVGDPVAYPRCREVAADAHRQGLHGLIAPAATRLGHTLALFMDQVPDTMRPVRSEKDRRWATLPPDPRLNGHRDLLA